MDLRTLRSILKYLVTLLTLLAWVHQATARQQPATPGVTIGGGRTIPPVRKDSGPKPKTIQGTVEDANGNPIENAHVMVRDTKTSVTRTLTTDAKGVYSGTAFPGASDYEIVAEFRGQTSEKKAISSYLNREEVILNFQLKVVVAAAPANASRGTAAGGPQLETFDLVKLQVALDLPAGVPAPIPAVLLIHGYGEDRAVWADFKKALLARGWAVMTLDLRGHGQSKTKNGQPIAASSAWRNSPHEFPLDIETAMTWLKTQTRINSNKIAVVGVDVGANLALIASGRYKQVRTVVAVNPILREGQEMAGGAQDYRPRSALIFSQSDVAGNSVKAEAQSPAQLQIVDQGGGTVAWFQNPQVTNSVFQWLKDTF